MKVIDNEDGNYISWHLWEIIAGTNGKERIDHVKKQSALG